MRKLPTHAREDRWIIMRRYERASTLLTSKPTSRRLGETARRYRRFGSMLDRLLHHGHVLKNVALAVGALKLRFHGWSAQ